MHEIKFMVIGSPTVPMSKWDQRGYFMIGVGIWFVGGDGWVIGRDCIEGMGARE
jgi:hypothetical protein